MCVPCSLSASTLTNLTLGYPLTCRPRDSQYIERKRGRDGCENEPGIRRAYARVSSRPLTSGTDHSHELTAYSSRGRVLATGSKATRGSGLGECGGTYMRGRSAFSRSTDVN